ncbi:MAG: hypothetical protein WEB09_01960 [Nitriliruptor sp.]
MDPVSAPTPDHAALVERLRVRHAELTGELARLTAPPDEARMSRSSLNLVE